MNDDHSQEEHEHLSWMELIRQSARNNELFGSTCHLYSKAQANDTRLDSKQRCLCGRLARKHSFDGTSRTELLNKSKEWGKFTHACEAPVTVFGMLQNKTKFVRWDHTEVKPPQPQRTSLPTMAQILLDDAGSKQPTLLISCYGGAKYFKMSDKLEKEFMDGIGQAAATEGVWFLTAGLNSGVSKVIGQSIWRYSLLSEKPTNHTIIGLTSWGCLSDKTHDVLRRQAEFNSFENRRRRDSIAKMSAPLMAIRTGNWYSDPSLLTLDEHQPDTLEINHTHFLLLDDGSQGDHKIGGKINRYYIHDGPRNSLVNELYKLTEKKCCAVTIIIEGGLYSIDVISNDLDAKRPVVIISGSGRLADLISKWLELKRHEVNVGKDEIKQKLITIHAQERHLKKVDTQEVLDKYILDDYVEKIEKTILKPENQPYLSVFRLDDNTSLTDTIFLATFKARLHQEKENQTNNERVEYESLKKLLILSIDWNYVNGINYIFEHRQTVDYDEEWNTDLFEEALIKNRPIFIDYFLRRQHDVLQTKDYIEFTKNNPKSTQINSTSFSEGENSLVAHSNISHTKDEENRVTFGRKFIITKLYEKPIDHLKSYYVTSVTDLDNLYYKLIGPYADSFFHVKSTKDRIKMDLHDKITSFLSLFKCFNNDNTTVSTEKPHSSKIHPNVINVTLAIVPTTAINSSVEMIELYRASKIFGHEGMMRDLFLWSVICGHAEMSFILLLHIRSRIVASLIAAGITRRFVSTKDGYLDEWHKFQKHSKDYEEFATSCIDACYERSERRACQLLLREIPLFGNITCMQVAISFRIQSFINSRCFDQVLTRQWYGALDQTANKSLLSKILFIISLFTIGLSAPLSLNYRNDYTDKNKQEELNVFDDERSSSYSHKHSKWEGIEDQDSTNMNYFQKVRQFHRTPLVRMSYHFLAYIWMLLAFSYMMLFEMKSQYSSIHWTEIYVIITISAMLIEDLRKIAVEYYTQMTERWCQSDLWMIPIYATPYVLFYIGIGLHFGSHFGSTIRPNLFAAARIVLALDLEIWFLFSLRFVSAVKLLGPKLFMIRNMLRDLFGFVYIIFICIAAYGIVSGSLTMYNSIEFTAQNLSAAIFYRPYWFLYADVDDAKSYLDGIIGSPSSTSDEVAEAITNQVLLAFQMLFINILLLSLLIAVFNFTINKVQDKSEYFWRYQRYELIREYFEKPFLAYPPLSLIGYLCPIIKFIFGIKGVLRIFKRFCTYKMNKNWTDFEYAATYNYTRTFVDIMCRDTSTLIIPTFSETDELKIEIESLKRQNNEMRNIIDKMDIQSNKMTPAINWMITAMDRVKMSKERPLPLVTASSSND